jgi:5-methylcytosine-specific restriction endonuclease McrA
MNSKVKYSKELLEEAAKDSISVAQVIRKLGLKQSGSNSSHIKSRLVKYQIDCSHFRGQASNYGIKHKGGNLKLDPNSVLCYDRLNGRRENVFRLRSAMLKSGISHECSICGQPPEWQGKPLVLEIDHIDGNGVNNQLSNLRFLCGHCHSQTSTFGSRKRKVLSASDEIRKIEDRNVMKEINKVIKNLESEKKEECQHNWVLDGHNAGDPICSRCYKRPEETK